MPSDVEVSDFCVTHEGALEFCGVGDEFPHVEGASISAGIVLLDIQSREDRLIEGLSQKCVSVNFSQPKRRQQLVRSHAHAASAREHQLHVGRQVDGFGMLHHFLHVLTIDGFGQGERPVSQSPKPSIRCRRPQCLPTGQIR